MISLSEGFLLAAVLWISQKWYWYHKLDSKLRTVPVIGGDGFIASYIGCWKSLAKMQDMIEEGYHKYPDGAFRVPTFFTPTGWLVVLNGRELFEDVRKARPEELCFRQSVDELLQMSYLCEYHIKPHQEHYHNEAVRVSMPRSFPGRFGAMNEELEIVMKEQIPATEEWAPFGARKTFMRIISRITARMLLGLPFCRNEEYLTLAEGFTINMFVSASLLQFLPTFTRSFVAKFISKDPSTNAALRRILGPTIEERMGKEKELGPKWEGKPNDLITWLLDLSPPHLRFVQDLVQRMMFIILASIHTTLMLLVNVVFNLAARQEYIEPLRAEVEEVVAKYGWTKDAMSHLHKLDSFMKECTRITSSSSSMNRSVMKDFALSNGTILPTGTTLTCPARSRHMDPSLYENPEHFDGYRFLKIREKEANSAAEFEASSKHQMISLSYEFQLFGHGRFACPGRFFAIAEIKLILAHLLLDYDIKLPLGKTEVPKGTWAAGNYAPDMDAPVMIRKRAH